VGVFQPELAYEYEEFCPVLWACSG